LRTRLFCVPVPFPSEAFARRVVVSPYDESWAVQATTYVALLRAVVPGVLVAGPAPGKVVPDVRVPLERSKRCRMSGTIPPAAIGRRSERAARIEP
jgi:hypothetical protein